jgi:hypothetical protein
MPRVALRAFLLAALFTGVSLWAQLTVSTLRGTATDQAGAVVVDAQIRVVHQGTNFSREVTTMRTATLSSWTCPEASIV